ncbi:MAG: helix-turn-helix domain-containing protein [Symploca sp. SIO1C4]|uniref:Helix-turn-helix domain-containing protein n=1 Tax=Symploca sp. SIO1C4 TaxID=2607765 RepID=A0A6B3NCE5_9CYAN|nr:helix-turn-helix domain-containing protein [Symploca sp. SIO2E9]NER30769.1 helix-turn-helix domain-containing protein [Symploca sp. SIO1C4]
MTNHPSLGARELNLISLYSYCQLGMTPQRFYSKWEVTHEQIALICSRSISTVRGWFRRGSSYRRPTPNDLRHLALMDFLLEHFEEIPEELWQLLCPTDTNSP